MCENLRCISINLCAQTFLNFPKGGLLVYAKVYDDLQKRR